VRNIVLRDAPRLEAWPMTRFRVPLAGGDTLLGALHHPHGGNRGPLIVLIHGLTGCEASAYMRFSAQVFLSAGHPVLRLNLRGAGPSRVTSRGLYHAGRTDDIEAVFAALPADDTAGGVVAIGYSMGANILLRYMAEGGAGIDAGIAVSAPIDLAMAAQRFHHPANLAYRAWLLARVRKEAEGAKLPPALHAAAARARSFYAFDDDVIAPLFGFTSSADYYSEASALPVLDRITRPVMLVHAKDDPWVPAAMYGHVDWCGLPRLTLCLPSGGGHVGFHDIAEPPAWHDRAALAFLAELGLAARAGAPATALGAPRLGAAKPAATAAPEQATHPDTTG